MNSDKSLQTMFDTKIGKIESKLEELIDTKLTKQMDDIDTLSVKDKERNYASAITTLERTYSDVFKEFTEFRQILQEARNDESKKEKRSNDFIIYGLTEKGRILLK